MARNGRIHIFKNLVSEIKTFAVVEVFLFFALRTFPLFALGFHTPGQTQTISWRHFSTALFFERSLQRIPVTCDETSEKKNKQKNKQTRGRRLVVRAFPLNLRKTNALV